MFKLLNSKSDLAQRVIRSGAWVLTGHGAGQAIRLLGNLIMTRILAPEMFGIMGVASMVIVGLALFSDLGIRQNIIQSKRGDEQDYLNTAWTLQILRGFVLWAMTIFIAGLLYFFGKWQVFDAQSAYSDPQLPWVVATLAFSVIIQGFSSTKYALANRNLQLGRVTLIELSGQVFSLIAMISWGLVHKSIWALVVAALIGELTRLLLSYIAIPGPGNRLHWNKEYVSEIFSFGKWIFLTSIVGFLSSYGDRLMLGAILSASLFGLYSQAVMLLAPVQETLQKLISSVAFPAFSETYRQDPGKLKDVYYKFRKPIDIASLFLFGFIFAAGHLIVVILYDSRYQEAGRLLEILSISLFESRYSVAGQVYMAIGKPKLITPLILTRILALFILMPFLYLIGGTGLAVWAVGLSVLFTIPLNIYFKIQNNIFDLKKELQFLPLVPLGLATGYSLVYLTKNILFNT